MTDRTVRSVEIAEYLGGELKGPDIEIHTAKAAHAAEPGCLVFLQKPIEQALERINETSDVFAIVTASVSERIQSSHVVVNNARLDFAKAVERFFARVPTWDGVAKTAVVGENVTLGPNVSIGECSVIEDNVKIGGNTRIYHHVTVLEGSVIGVDCTLLSHSVVGEDGFGFVYDENDEAVRFPHIGIAELEDNVQIGCFSMVARAAMERTLVEKGTKIGDYVQVAHNSTVGRHCMLAAYAKVGSGAIVEDHVFLGVRSSSRENVRIGRWAFIGQGALILEDVPPRAVMIGAPARFLRERGRE